MWVKNLQTEYSVKAKTTFDTKELYIYSSNVYQKVTKFAYFSFNVMLPTRST